MNLKLKKVQNHPYLAPSETKREGVSAAQKWAVGLIEGDGHLGLTWSNKEKTNLSPVLKISLHNYNARAIYKLKSVLGAGNITHHGNLISLRLRSEKAWWNHVFPLFKACALRTHKYYDVLIIMHVLSVKRSNTHALHTFAYRKQAYFNHCRNLVALTTKPHASKPSPVWMTKTHSVQPWFNFQTAALTMPEDVFRRGLDLDWLAGFIEAEGSFYILNSGRHGFALGQKHDGIIIAAVSRLFKVNASFGKVRPKYVLCDTTNSTSLALIARLMHKRLLGMKSFVFTLWARSLKKKKKDKKACAVAKRLISQLTQNERFTKTKR